MYLYRDVLLKMFMSTKNVFQIENVNNSERCFEIFLKNCRKWLLTIYTLWPKIIEPFPESWKFPNFDASDLRMTGHDSNFASSQSKSKTARHRNLRPVPLFVLEICCFKVGYFSTSHKTFNNFGTEGEEAFTSIFHYIVVFFPSRQKSCVYKAWSKCGPV